MGNEEMKEWGKGKWGKRGIRRWLNEGMIERGRGGC